MHPRRPRGSLKGREKIQVKNKRKSPWRQVLNGPVPNGWSSSGFWLVPENVCFFLPNHRAGILGVVSCLLIWNIWVLRRGFTQGGKFQSQHKMYGRLLDLSARNSLEIRWNFRRYCNSSVFERSRAFVHSLISADIDKISKFRFRWRNWIFSLHF